MITTIGERRSLVQSSLTGITSSRIWRDITPVITPWGPIERNAALYRKDGKAWRMVVDEFGGPTTFGKDIYHNFARKRVPKKLVRIANKNQLQIKKDQIIQLSPFSWTSHFLELSVIYDFLKKNRPTVSGSSLQKDSAAHAILSLFVRSLGGDIEGDELSLKLEKLARRIEGLPLVLQALVKVFDSDLGKPDDPFVQINSISPSELNKVSQYRCWTGGQYLEDALELLVPSVAFTGWDIYNRPILGPTPNARIRQLCVLELNWPVTSNPIFQVDYEELFSQLQELMERCRKDHDTSFRFVDGIIMETKLEAFMSKAEFWLKFWSHHFHEVLVLGDIVPDRVYNIKIEGPGPIPFIEFKREKSPLWKKGDVQNTQQLLTNWCRPYCPTGTMGEWHESLGFTTSLT